MLGADGADLGDGDLEVGEQLEQERLELVVGPVDLVDEEHGPVAGPDGLEQRPLEQELRPEQLVDRVLVVEVCVRRAPGSAASGGRSPTRRGPGWCRCPRSTAAGSGGGPKTVGQGLGHLGLADADLALEKEGPAQGERDVQRGRQPTVGEVVHALAARR